MYDNYINNINEHNNNNNFTTHVPYFSVSSIGSNHMMHDNNNIPIEVVNTMEQLCVTSTHEAIWSSPLWLLHHSSHPPIGTRAAHANKHKECVINLPKGVTSSAHNNNDSIIDAMCYSYLIITH